MKAVSIAPDFALQVGKALPPVDDEAIEALWQEGPACLFNGSVMVLDGDLPHVRPMEYKLFYAILHNPKIHEQYPFTAVGVRGVTIADGKVLLGRRGHDLVAYHDLWECAPGGSLENGDYQAHLLDELEEETGLTRDLVTEVKPFAAVFNTDYPVIDLCCAIFLTDRAMALPLTSEEYTAFRWIDQLPTEDLVPTTPIILEESPWSPS